MVKILIYFTTVFLLVSCFDCKVIEQTRQIYYHEGDNVCAIDQKDYVKIIFSLEDKIVDTYVFGGAGCTWSFDSEFWSITVASPILVVLDDDGNHPIYLMLEHIGSIHTESKDKSIQQQH